MRAAIETTAPFFSGNMNELHGHAPLPGVALNEVKPPDAKVPLRVLLADDHEMLRLGTAAFLKQELGCEICAEAADGREALKLSQATKA